MPRITGTEIKLQVLIQIGVKAKKRRKDEATIVRSPNVWISVRGITHVLN